MEKDETNEDDNNNDIQSESSSWEIKPKIKEVNPSIERTGEKTGSDSWGTKPKNETKKGFCSIIKCVGNIKKSKS